jgi:hypothetical protein
VLFIGGSGRNGSTLVERLLAEVPSIVALGEVRHLGRGLLDDERCGCGEPFSTCAFWPRVGEKAFGGWDQIDGRAWSARQDRADRHRRLPRLLLPGATRDPDIGTLVGDLGRVYEGAVAATGADVLVDSSKHASTAALVRLVPGVELRVLHLVRDPRGVAHSWAKVVRRPEAGAGAADPLMPRYRPARTALWWDEVNASLSALRVAGVPVLQVRYEDLLADPVRGLERIVRFAGVDPAPGWDGFIDGRTATLGPGHSVAGNPMRFETGRVELRTDDAWRVQLAPRPRRTVTLLTAPLLLAYRYPLRPARAT